jgi:hypothetical protein
MGAFWTAARILPHKETLALHCLNLSGFTTYCPRIRESRRPQWPQGHHYAPAVSGLRLRADRAAMARGALEPRRHPPGDGRHAAGQGARHGDHRSQEAQRNGVVELQPPPDFQRGDQVRITRGLFAGQLALFEGMRGHERVAVLLALLGRVELQKGDIVGAT